MARTQGIVVFVGKLDDRTSELCKILVHKVSQLVACKNCLFLKDAYIAPCIDDLCLDIPECGIAEKICTVMKKSCRSDDFAVTTTLDVHHLCGLRTHEPYHTVLRFLLFLLGRKRQTGQKYKQDI